MRDADQQFLLVERFGDVVRRAGLEPFDDVVGRVQCREEDDRNLLRLRIGFQFLGHFVTVHAGHHDVEQDQVRGLFFDGLQRFHTVIGSDDPVFLVSDQHF